MILTSRFSEKRRYKVSCLHYEFGTASCAETGKKFQTLSGFIGRFLVRRSKNGHIIEGVCSLANTDFHFSSRETHARLNLSRQIARPNYNLIGLLCAAYRRRKFRLRKAAAPRWFPFGALAVRYVIPPMNR